VKNSLLTKAYDIYMYILCEFLRINSVFVVTSFACVTKLRKLIVRKIFHDVYNISDGFKKFERERENV